MVNNLKIEYIDIDKLTHYENNSKIHTQNQIKHIANSIKEFGFNDPVGIAGENNIVLEGNGRVEAAKLCGMTKLPCIRLDHMSEEERKAYVIAHNSTNLETTLDDNVLLQQLKDLQNFDFTDFGVSEEIVKLQNIDDNFYKELVLKETKHLVRNEFFIVGKYGVPLIKKQDIDLALIRLYSYTKYDDKRNVSKTIHFFMHDYRFENVYANAENTYERLKQYYCLLSPDYSLYTDMPLALQINNVFKSRWCGAFWQTHGLKVIPTISWSDESSFEFCFDGVEFGSIIAVSTHGNKKCKEEFMKGYNEMLQIIKPSAIICYGKPFKEMQGKILCFPYNHNEHNEVIV